MLNGKNDTFNDPTNLGDWHGQTVEGGHLAMVREKTGSLENLSWPMIFVPDSRKASI